MQDFIPFVQQNMILSLVWVGVFIMLIMNIIKTRAAQYKEIQVSELTQLINREQGVVVDVRAKNEFDAGHITDSVHISPSEIKENNFGSLESRKADPIIVVCKTGQSAAESANNMASAGFERVYILRDGIVSWSDASLPLIRTKKTKK